MLGVETPTASSAVDLQTQDPRMTEGTPMDNPLDSPSVQCLEGLVWEGGANMDRIASSH